jgi:hypothetical protein
MKDVQRGKADPEVYLLAASRVGVPVERWRRLIDLGRAFHAQRFVRTLVGPATYGRRGRSTSAWRKTQELCTLNAFAALSICWEQAHGIIADDSYC